MARKQGVTHYRQRRGKGYRSKYQPSKKNTAKRDRDRIVVRPAPALVDPMRTLGHPPRGRRKW